MEDNHHGGFKLVPGVNIPVATGAGAAGLNCLGFQVHVVKLPCPATTVVDESIEDIHNAC